MKQMKCEVCGCTELLKQDDFFICQECGGKYSVEDAKKLLVEVASSPKLDNLYERARKSLEVNDLKNAADYYKQILDENPKDWEAYFFSYLGEHTSCKNAELPAVATKLANALPSAYDMAIDIDDVAEKDRRVRVITTYTVARLTTLANAGGNLIRQYEGANVFTPAGKVNNDLYRRMCPLAFNSIASAVVAFDPMEQKLEAMLSSDNGAKPEVCNECLLAIRRARYNLANQDFSPSAGMKEKAINPDYITKYANKLKESDPNFVVPAPQPASSGGCYVATCVYGSYDCPQVWTLRRYRDDTLGSTWYGRLFVRTYYAISPTLVKWFGHTDWFKSLWRGKLDRMVEKLQSNGFESTPYEDKEW